MLFMIVVFDDRSPASAAAQRLLKESETQFVVVPTKEGEAARAEIWSKAGGVTMFLHTGFAESDLQHLVEEMNRYALALA